MLRADDGPQKQKSVTALTVPANPAVPLWPAPVQPLDHDWQQQPTTWPSVISFNYLPSFASFTVSDEISKQSDWIYDMSVGSSAPSI